MYRKCTILAILVLILGLANAKKGIPWDEDLTKIVDERIRELLHKQSVFVFDKRGNFLNLFQLIVQLWFTFS